MNAGQTTLTVITAVAAIAAAALSWWAGRQATGQREHQARREEWWRRFQWATDLALSAEDGEVRAGLALLAVLTDSPLATQDELDAIIAVSGEIFTAFAANQTGFTTNQAGFTANQTGQRDDGDSAGGSKQREAADVEARTAAGDDGSPASGQG